LLKSQLENSLKLESNRVTIRISLRNSWFGRELWPTTHFIILKECLSGVGTPYSREMKGICLTLARRQLYRNEILIKILRAPF